MSSLDVKFDEIKNALGTNESESEIIIEKLKESIEVLLKFVNQKNDEYKIRQPGNNEIKIDEFKSFFDK